MRWWPQRAGQPQGPASPVADGWPDLNTLVTVAASDAPGWPERLSRIEDVTPDRIALATPRGRAGELEQPEDGTAFELRWPGPRGEFVLPVVLAERVRGVVDVWWVQPVQGKPIVSQRRNFVRAAATGWPARVGLTWMLPEEGTAVGDLVELSEGGIRARVSGWEAPAGTPVAVRLTLAMGVDDLASILDVAGGRGPAGSGVAVVEHELMGTALRVQPSRPTGGSGGSAGGDDDVEVVVQLHDAGRDGDALRALVFSWQRQARRL